MQRLDLLFPRGRLAYEAGCFKQWDPGCAELALHFCPDICPPPGSPADLDGDGLVGIADLLLLLAAWGRCPPPPLLCPADLDVDLQVGVSDLLLLLAGWS